MDDVELFYDLDYMFEVEFQLSNRSGYTVVFRIEQNKDYDYLHPERNHATLTIAKYLKKSSEMGYFNVDLGNNILDIKKPMTEKEFMKFKKELFSKCDINEWVIKYLNSDITPNMFKSNSVRWQFKTDNGFSVMGYDEYPSDWKELLRCINDIICFSGVEISCERQNLETADDIRSVAPVENIIDITGKPFTRSVNEFEFYIGGYGEVSFGMEITRSNDRIFLYVYKIDPYYVSKGNKETSSFKIMISEDELKDFISVLVNKHRILDWNENYQPPEIICDGTSWSVHIGFADGEIFESDGSNAYPHKWKRFLAYINHIVRFSGLKFF